MTTPEKECAFCLKALKAGTKADACVECIDALQREQAGRLPPRIANICKLCKKNNAQGKSDGCKECIDALHREQQGKRKRKQHDSLDIVISDILYGRLPIQAAVERLIG